MSFGLINETRSDHSLFDPEWPQRLAPKNVFRSPRGTSDLLRFYRQSCCRRLRTEDECSWRGMPWRTSPTFEEKHHHRRHLWIRSDTQHRKDGIGTRRRSRTLRPEKTPMTIPFQTDSNPTSQRCLACRAMEKVHFQE